MLDIRLIRENAVLVKENLEKRQDPAILKILKDLIAEDKTWRKCKLEGDKLRARRNEITAEIKEAKKQGKKIDSLLKEAKGIPQNVKAVEGKSNALQEKIRLHLMQLPNLLRDSVPYGKGEEGNVVEKEFGKRAKKPFEIKHHGQLAVELDLADFERAVKVSGTGFFYLKGELALLDLALQRYAIDKLMKKGYTLIQPPHLMRRKPYEGVVSLADFEDVMYKTEADDLYLIATAEHPMAAMYSNEILEEEQLPIKLCGVSPCYRREIGKHGIDERGLFRVHQFNKVEQFVFCLPEDSEKYFDEIVNNAEELLQEIGVPFQRTNVCTGDIGFIAAKKFDLMGYSPREDKFIELMSASHCTDFQARRLNIKYRKKGTMEKETPHTLNNTLVATTRFLRVLIENFQTEKGTIEVPKPLRPYMNGVSEIPSEKAK